MARDWFLRNRNAGNVLRMQGINIDLEDATGAGEGTPNANEAVINIVNVGAGASTLTIDGSKSIIGDKLIIISVGESGAYTINLLGDMAPGQIESDGHAATLLIYNGSEFVATATPSAAP